MAKETFERTKPHVNAVRENVTLNFAHVKIKYIENSTVFQIKNAQLISRAQDREQLREYLIANGLPRVENSPNPPHIRDNAVNHSLQSTLVKQGMSLTGARQIANSRHLTNPADRKLLGRIVANPAMMMGSKKGNFGRYGYGWKVEEPEQ